MKRYLSIVIILFLLTLFLKKYYLITLPGLGETALFTLLAGFAIITAFYTGLIFSRISFPKIVGYLFTGILFGPGIFHIFTHHEINALDFLTQLALGLITISAGRELKLSEMKKNISLLSRIIGAHLLFIPIILAVTVLLLFKVNFIVALLTGLILTTASPAVPMAMISEYNLKGRFPQMVLSTLIMRDVLIIFIFSAFASLYSGSSGTLQSLLWLFTSLITGAVLAIIYFYFRKLIVDYPFIFLLLFLIAMYQTSVIAPLNYIIMTLAFGFTLENGFNEGEKLLEIIESGSLALYTIFFSLAGASLEIDVLLKIGVAALILVTVRAILLFSSTYFSTLKVDTLKYTLFTGFIPQAGVSIGLAVILKSYFPQFAILGDLIVASAVLNEIAGPFFFKWGIIKSQL